MPIRLEDDLEAGPIDDDKSLFTKIVNAFRIHNVPALNFVIITILGFFLLKLTTKYTGLYMKNSLITIIVTNLVLYGISETLAQSLLSYKPLLPQFSFIINQERAPVAELRQEVELNDEDIDNDETVNQFVDYIQNDSLDEEFVPPAPPLEPLTYFQFERLAGFMCWGFIMGFAQCLWYKFLQIYSKDPKFIEVLRKVLTDQLCYSPVSLFCFFTYGTMVLENGSWDDTKVKLSKIYLKTLIINYSVWFPVQFFNFLVVPRSFQVPFSSSISVLWNCFLSMRNSSS